MFVQLCLAILTSYLSCVASLPTDLVSNTVQERDPSKKYLSLPINVVRKNLNSDGGVHQFKRGPIESPIHNAAIMYTIDLLFGSNQQPLTVTVDTGSSDLWVPDISAKCYGQSDCNATGVYDPSKSTTSKKLNQTFNFLYGDMTDITGSYVLDDVTFPHGPTIKQAQFGDATIAGSAWGTFGIFGIGLNETEGPYFDGLTNTMYANFPWVMKDQGFISKAAYSIFMNSEEATTGTIVFGGIDNAKVDGSLVKLPGVFSNRLGVQGDSVTVDGTVTNLGQGIILDTGSQYSSLPYPVLDNIATALSGSKQVPEVSPYVADCVQPDKNFTFTLGNGKQTIQVPYSTFIIPQPGADLCNVTLTYSTNGDGDGPIFGEEVLRNLYLVFDIEDNEISVGQAKFTTDSDIIPIE